VASLSSAIYFDSIQSPINISEAIITEMWLVTNADAFGVHRRDLSLFCPSPKVPALTMMVHLGLRHRGLGRRTSTN
jgi:hypothetical protein